MGATRRSTPALGVAGIDANGETAAEHLRNALQLLRMASWGTPGGTIPLGTMTAEEVSGVARRVQQALQLLEGEPSPAALCYAITAAGRQALDEATGAEGGT